MEIVVRGHHIAVPARFRQHAAEKLAKLAKLDQKAMRVDVEVSKERNSRQSDRRERVELTIRSRGPLIRAEAAAEDRYTALDMAFAKLESRLRRASDRRKVRHGDNSSVRSPAMLAAVSAQTPVADSQAGTRALDGDTPAVTALNGSGEALRPTDETYRLNGSVDGLRTAAAEVDDRLVPIQMEGEGPLVVREKTHPAKPMTIDQALLEMELVGHDFYLFHDSECDRFSVVYRRRGYDYGVIRLVEERVEE